MYLLNIILNLLRLFGIFEPLIIFLGFMICVFVCVVHGGVQEINTEQYQNKHENIQVCSL